MPSRLAPRWLGWQQRQRGVSSAPFGAALAGMPFLPDIFGPFARVVVEIAFGANIKGLPDFYPWWDVTTDVRQADGNGITISPLGRSDEFSNGQPAQCSFELDNPNGDYSKGQASKWWPFIRRNTPVRVRVTLDGNSWYIRFQGQITGMPPTYDTAGKMPIVTVNAAGKLQQLKQGKKPLRSALHRAIMFGNPVAYWSLATGYGSELSSGQRMAATGTWAFGNDNKAVGAEGAITHSGTDGGLAGRFTITGSTTSFRLDFMFRNDAGSATNSQIGVLMAGGGVATFNPTPSGPTGLWHHERIEIFNSGGLAHFDWWIDGVQTVSNGITAAAYGNPYSVTLGPGAPGTVNQDSFSDVAVFVPRTITPNIFAAFGGYLGETVIARLARLCAEQGVPINIIGDSDTLMGPQGVDTFVNLLRKCEAADLGMLGDGLGPGLFYATRQFAYSRSVDMTIDASLGQLGDPLEPMDDDQRDRNLITATNEYTGGNATFEQVDGPLGTATIDTYDSTPGSDLSLLNDIFLLDVASWVANEGTFDEPYRYPSFNLDLAAVPAIARNWLEMPFMGRIEATNISSIVPQHPVGSASLLLEGYGEFLSPTAWTVNGNLAPYGPNRVMVIANATGDTGEFISWVAPDKGAMMLSGEYPAGATSLTLNLLSAVVGNTFDGMIADDFPLDLDIGGRQVTMTAAAAHSGTPGSGGTQVITVQPTAYALHDGNAVDTWNKNVLGL